MDHVADRSAPPASGPPPAAPPGEGPLVRWARFAVRRRWAVLGGWVAILALLGLLATSVGGEFVDSFELPGAESQRAVDLLTERFPAQAGDSATVVVRAEAGVADPAIQPRVEALVAEAATLPEVAGAVSPYQAPGALSPDGRYAYATVQYDKAADMVAPASVERLTELVDAAAGDGLAVEVGGQVVAASEQEPPGESELIGVAAAMVILLVAFGSVVAMGLPIVTALVGLGAGVLGTVLAARAFDMSTFTTAFVAMIGLGVGIDYALFVVTRFREGLHAGLSVEDAVVRSVDTAGRAVAFAGVVVAIALLGLFAIGIPFVSALGTAAAIVVLFSVLVALTLLPALLALVGRRIDRWSIPGLRTVERGDRDSFWYRWAAAVQRRPVISLVASVTLLLALTLPVLDLRLGSADAGNNPTSSHTRRAYDLLADGFGPGFNGPLVLAVEQPGGLDPAALDRLGASLGETPGVAAVSPPQPNPAGDTAVLQVIPATSPQDEATTDLVHRLRDEAVPAGLAGSGASAYVGGATAAFVDVDDQVSERLFLFFAIVIGLSVLLLAAVFRSVLVPIKAALMNLLAIGAAYGVLVAVFQWGWGAGLIGVERTGPIESFLPMMLFAILFGLSMDYEVFLVSRIREDYLATGDPRAAIGHGLGVTARVIAAAAAIMVSVFLSFVLGDERIIKLFGLGLATAILVDATIIRLVLVPAVMELMGRWSWWLPGWLDRLLPRLNVEGSATRAPAAAPVAPVPASVGGVTAASPAPGWDD